MSDELGGWGDGAGHHGADGPGEAGFPYGDDWHDLSGGLGHGHPYGLDDPLDPSHPLGPGDPGDPGDGGAGRVADGGDPHDGGEVGHGPTEDAADGTEHGFVGGRAAADPEAHDGSGHGPDGDGADGDAEPPGLAQPVDAHDFPPHLDLDVLPADGLAWVDVDLLGDIAAPPAVPLVVADPPHALLADLHAQDGTDGAPSWAAAAVSEDPAVRALALFWQP